MKNHFFNQPISPVVGYFQDLRFIGSFCYVGSKDTVLPLMIDLNSGEYALDLTESIQNSNFTSTDEYLCSDRFLDFLIALKDFYGEPVHFELKNYCGRQLFTPEGFSIDHEEVKANNPEVMREIAV